MVYSIEFGLVKDFLTENGIFFSNRQGEYRLADSEMIFYSEQLSLESGGGILFGNYLPKKWVWQAMQVHI